MVGAGVGPAAFEAAAVVGQDPLDGDPVAGVEADELVEERDRAVGCLVGIDGREAEPAVVVDRDEQVLPAGLPLRPPRRSPVTRWPGLQDPTQLLDVDVDQPARTGPRSGSPLRGRGRVDKPGAAVAAQDRMHRRGGHPDRPADHVRPLPQLLPRPQDRLLDRSRRPPRRAVRPARAIASDSPRRPRLTHFDAVCREQPTTTAAAVIVTPPATRSHSRCR